MQSAQEAESILRAFLKSDKRIRISGTVSEQGGGREDILPGLSDYSILQALHGCMVGMEMVVEDIPDAQIQHDLRAMIVRAEEIRVDLVGRMKVHKNTMAGTGHRTKKEKSHGRPGK